MNWSRYNLLFRSERHGHLLYSALTNSFACLDERTAAEVERIRRDPDAYDFAKNPELYLQLVLAKVLVEPREEEELVRVIRLRRLYERFDPSMVSLTVVPTLDCNFACSYCYERFRRPVHMSEEVEKRIVAFVKGFNGLQRLQVEWYGGEPTLRFETMRRISRDLGALGIPWDASLVSNGYLLGVDMVEKLAEMRIDSVQITLDGPAMVHDARRTLVDGGPTYERILQNIEGLLTNWTGALSLRVNVDRTNRDEFFTIRQELLQRFIGKNLWIYPGFVDDTLLESPYGGCTFDRSDACRFQIDAYRRHGVEELGFYPEPSLGCTATRKNGFVIGPQGEIYKCHGDVGIQERVVGNLDAREPWDLGLLAAYMIGSDAFENQSCRECYFVPLCDGGCANARLRARSIPENPNICVSYKEMLPEWLECHFEITQRRAAASQAETVQTEPPSAASD